MQIIKNNWTYILGAVIGAIAGYIYWRFVGCISGTCPIASSPTSSLIYGLIIGVLLGGVFKKKEKK